MRLGVRKQFAAASVDCPPRRAGLNFRGNSVLILLRGGAACVSQNPSPFSATAKVRHAWPMRTITCPEEARCHPPHWLLFSSRAFHRRTRFPLNHFGHQMFGGLFLSSSDALVNASHQNQICDQHNRCHAATESTRACLASRLANSSIFIMINARLKIRGCRGPWGAGG
jgi:hypothetical protein